MKRERPPGGLERDALFAIMSAFASGVAVMTTVDADNEPKGLSSNAFCSVSADPPLVLICVDKSSRTLRALIERRSFVVNFLSEGTEDICRAFASKEDNKFLGIAWQLSRSGLPVLSDVLAYAECVLVQQIAAGDHMILLGLVVDGKAPERMERPLLYFRRSFGSWCPLPGSVLTDS